MEDVCVWWWGRGRRAGGRGDFFLQVPGRDLCLQKSIKGPDNLKVPSISSKPGTLHIMEARQSQGLISKRLADNRDCILQGWTFSPRISHYQVLVMLLSQPLGSCPASHRQGMRGEKDGGGAALHLLNCSPCNSLHEAPWFRVPVVLDLQHPIYLFLCSGLQTH